MWSVHRRIPASSSSQTKTAPARTNRVRLWHALVSTAYVHEIMKKKARTLHPLDAESPVAAAGRNTEHLMVSSRRGRTDAE